MHVRRYTVLLLLCLVFVAQIASAASNVVISQVYGGGGNSGATLKNDFIEIFNRGTTTVSLTGWSVQYASSTGSSWAVTTLSGSLAPGQYYLIQEAAGTGGTVSLPTPDSSGSIAMSGTAGKVALVNSTSPLSGTCPVAIDLVGFGSGTNCFEGTGPTATLSNTTAAIRASNGCTDSDNNATNFATGAPNPRNRAAATNTCPNSAPPINAPANPITTKLSNAAPFNVSLTGSDDGGVYNWSATAGTGVASVSVVPATQGTANVSYNVTLAADFVGTATFTATLSDNVNAAVNQAVNIRVDSAPVNNPPAITPPANPITTVEQNAPAFTVSLTGTDDGAVYNWSATPGTGLSNVTVSGGQTAATATFTVTLQGGFHGTASFTATLSDNVNTPATQPVNITVTQPPPPPDHLVISQVYGGGGNAGAPFQRDFVELYNPTNSNVDTAGWTIQYASATGTSWTNSQPLGGIIGPGEYYLIALDGGATGAPLPEANINGTISMAAAAGKVALVSNGDPLSGCPVGLDLDVVDFVGYGTTSTCREGSSNAPAPSNTTADLRKSGGNVDTNVNGADFVAGAPNPRRTAVISEIGPSVVTTDPVTGASFAPRDASIGVTFTEPVEVSAGWYDITCVSTGSHNDATVAMNVNTYVITPNVNFTAGEQCTVTVFKNFVHDTDTDDSAPNTDTLPANKSWTFTVATGATPAYPSDVHLTMGNPSDAVADTSFENNYLMEKPEFALSYSRDRGTPNWVSWHLADEWVGTLSRNDTFRPDPGVPPAWYRVQAFDYFASGFDRGHMTPNADRDKETSIPINQATFLMSNMVPQTPDNNQGPWANMENDLRTIVAAGNELYIVSGPAGAGGTSDNGFMTTLANGHVTVPAQTWKVVLVIPKASGNDVSRVTAGTRTIAVVLPNVQGIRATPWQNFLTTVDAVEGLTGYDFFENVPDAIENAIEAGTNGANPPGAANQNVSVSEDGSQSFTLDVASTGSSLTYTITSSPAHGTLSGSDGSRTYTPAPDFNGTDSFTYTVSNSSGTSNTAKVTISVLEVNDTPTATDDSKSTNEDTALTFAASDLTANDAAGPANESGQTLNVTSVTSTADTHGVVSLSSGQVSYTPDANYNGPASFSYQVCDNGVTGGLSDSKCASATVNLVINSVNDNPSAAIVSPATGVEGTAINVSGSASDVDAGESFTFGWSVTKDGSLYASGVGSAFSFTPDDNATYVVTLTAGDAHGGFGTASSSISVTNADPAIASVSGPVPPQALGTTTTIKVSYTDAGSADTHTATFTWDDNSTSNGTCAAGTCTATHTYAGAGVYRVAVTLADDDGGTSSSSFEYVVVYDPAAGFVSGAGWINSPAGALVASPTLAGKATFGFVSKYQRGQTKPSGKTEFHFHATTFDFSSTSYDWLVIAGSRAQYKGTGTVNGDGSYGFLLTAIDGDTKGNPSGVDKFRIKIWDKSTGNVVYDNVAGASDDIDAANPQQLGGGSISIQNN